MHFDTFYQYFIFSKNWAYVSIILILPIFALFWNFVLYPTKDPEVRCLVDRLNAFFPKRGFFARWRQSRKQG